MADRFVSPITDIKPLGSLYFFKSGTNSPAVTYADESENVPNQAKIPVDASGNLPNVFIVGSVKVIYLDEFDNQYAARDPVGGDKALGDFTLWDAVVSYDFNDIVEASNGEFYRSLTNSNQSNDPTIDATKWELFKLRGIWNTNVAYSVGDVVQASDGNLNLEAALRPTTGPVPNTGGKTLATSAISPTISFPASPLGSNVRAVARCCANCRASS